ncbi:HAD family hydrolase [Natronoarchaeum sp. GCM10025703]|uniref:HAD family hydrolase n=1 Tax=Natronoarchaeum sp. GCM10025703 TaxID=3252685 RepID=UPI0036159896
MLFDNDGVLTWLTSLDVFSRAIETTFAEFGVTDPDPQHVEALYGITPDELQRICERYGVDPAPFWRRRDRNAALAQHAEIRAGRKPLYDDVEILDELDQELGIVSNNQADTVSYIVDYYDLPGSDICYGRQPTLDGIRRKKPDPYYLQQALSAIGTEDALYVGDSGSDVVAARQAGVDSAFVRRSHRQDLELPEQPTYEVEDLYGVRDIVDSTD